MMAKIKKELCLIKNNRIIPKIHLKKSEIFKNLILIYDKGQ